MDFYKNWDVFISNIDIVPEQLDGEKLIVMVSGLSRTREERELLGKEAAAGVKTSLESFLNSYVPMIVEAMKKYASQVGYNRDIFMNCVEKVREYVARTLYLDNLEYNTSHYVSWMVKSEVIHYIASRESLHQKTPVDKMKKEPRYDALPEMIEKISTYIPDEKQAESIKELLLACRNERERQLLGFRFGLEDGVPKTLQETADKFGISRERARQIESIALRRSTSHRLRRSKSLADFLND